MLQTAAAFSLLVSFAAGLGSLLAGIWLAVLGEWRAIGTGVFLILFSHWLLMIVLLPSLVFTAPATRALDRGDLLGAAFWSSLDNAYTFGIMTLWCCGVLFFFAARATGSDFLPRLFWSYGVALAPWIYLASKEPADNTSAISVLLAELAYLALIATAWFGRLSFPGALKIFAGFMAVALVIQVAVIATVLNDEAI